MRILEMVEEIEQQAEAAGGYGLLARPAGPPPRRPTPTCIGAPRPIR